MAFKSEGLARPDNRTGGRRRWSLSSRRAIVAMIGGLLAFGAGSGAAFAFRISPDLTAAPGVADSTVADELPSEAAARAYALNNPPAYPVRSEPAPETVAPAATDGVDTAEPLSNSVDDEAADGVEPRSQDQPYRAALDASNPAATSADSSNHGEGAGSSD